MRETKFQTYFNKQLAIDLYDVERILIQATKDLGVKIFSQHYMNNMRNQYIKVVNKNGSTQQYKLGYNVKMVDGVQNRIYYYTAI